jgi:hypothetical protein
MQFRMFRSQAQGRAIAPLGFGRTAETIEYIPEIVESVGKVRLEAQRLQEDRMFSEDLCELLGDPPRPYGSETSPFHARALQFWPRMRGNNATRRRLSDAPRPPCKSAIELFELDKLGTLRYLLRGGEQRLDLVLSEAVVKSVSAIGFVICRTLAARPSNPARKIDRLAGEEDLRCRSRRSRAFRSGARRPGNTTRCGRSIR